MDSFLELGREVGSEKKRTPNSKPLSL